MNQLTDSEARAALVEAGIITPYHNKERGLHSLQNQAIREQAEAMLADTAPAVALGACHQIAYDGREAMDLTYLLARSLLLGKGVAVRVLSFGQYATYMMRRHDAEYAERLEALAEVRVLVLLGAMGKGVSPYAGRDGYEIEWSLRNWMLRDRCLILQGEVPIAEAKGWWSDGFIDVFTGKLHQTFAQPPKLIPPGRPTFPPNRKGNASQA